jgi:hypothetical protein
VRSTGLIALGVSACLLAACGAGLPPEEDPLAEPTGPQGCESFGQGIDFTIGSTAGTIYWAADARIDPADPTVQSKIKFLFDIPQDQLPTGVPQARIRVTPVRNSALPAGAHVDTVFLISAIEPTDLTGFTGTGQVPLTLTVRYDPVACQVPPETEANLVLGRLNASGAWQEVCGDLANTGLAVREVSCSDGDLSFGIFGVIPRVGGTIADSTPPVFPPNSVSLTLRDRCDSCPAPSIELEWGPASDGTGSGILGYWIYVDGVRNTFTSDITANPTVRFILQTSGTVNTTLRHLYQVQAVDNAGNASTLFGALQSPT